MIKLEQYMSPRQPFAGSMARVLNLGGGALGRPVPFPETVKWDSGARSVEARDWKGLDIKLRQGPAADQVGAILPASTSYFVWRSDGFMANARQRDQQPG